MIEPDKAQIESFRRDGFLIVERLIPRSAAAEAASRFESLFRGGFETSIQPDEWNWREGRDRSDLTRQICNAWKADRTVARLVLRAEVGRACARLMGWSGARLAQDNVIWKPPGARPLGFHQDDSYMAWVVPPAMASCWIALDDTTAAGGTVEYVRGSHRWTLSPMAAEFHGPEDYECEMRVAAAREGVEPEIVRVSVPAGGGAFHHGGTWHGSGFNRSDRPRRSLVAHCIPAEARFHPRRRNPVYSRYMRAGDLEMDESFFPILWTEGGGRSAFLASYLA